MRWSTPTSTSSCSGCWSRRRPDSRSCTGPVPRFRSRWPGWTHARRCRRPDIWPGGRPAGHGLVVVGSHVGLTSRQVAVARECSDITEVELEVPAVADPARRDAHVAEITDRVVAALTDSDVLLFTSRTLLRDADPGASLQIARQVSTAVTEVVRGAVGAAPAWVVAKGGITSHDVAVRGLGIRRATVLGQLLPGLVSVFRPVEALPQVVGTPYVVFAGNVGDETTLAHVINLFREKRTVP